MSSGRPSSIPEGIGKKPQFDDLGLQLLTHKSAEFSTNDNVFKINLKTTKAVKTTFKLVHYKDGTEEEHSNSVFAQNEDKEVMTVRVAVPEPGWYKLNIFAKLGSDTSQSLPNVYTYLFEVKKCSKEAKPFPKQFADWNTDCNIKKPRYMDNKKDLSCVEFKVTVPGAKRVAAKVGDEWFHLSDKGNNKWSGDANLEGYRGKNVTVNLNASVGSDESHFVTLLQYTV